MLTMICAYCCSHATELSRQIVSGKTSNFFVEMDLLGFHDRDVAIDRNEERLATTMHQSFPATSQKDF